MKNILLILLAFLFVSCGSEVVKNNCFTGVSVSETLNLSNPEFVNLQVDAGNVVTTLPQSRRTVIIIKRSPTSIKVFDLECPEKNCSTPMSFDGLKLKCSCSGKEYNTLNGTPIDGDGCFALEYNVRQSGSSLQITR